MLLLAQRESKPHPSTVMYTRYILILTVQVKLKFFFYQKAAKIVAVHFFLLKDRAKGIYYTRRVNVILQMSVLKYAFE